MRMTNGPRAALVFAVLLGCADASSPTGTPVVPPPAPPSAPPPTALRDVIFEVPPSLVVAGGGFTAWAYPRSNDNSDYPAPIVWESSDTTVLVVQAPGPRSAYFRARGTGVATVSARVGTIRASYPVQVLSRPAAAAPADLAPVAITEFHAYQVPTLSGRPEFFVPVLALRSLRDGPWAIVELTFGLQGASLLPACSGIAGIGDASTQVTGFNLESDYYSGAFFDLVFHPERPPSAPVATVAAIITNSRGETFRVDGAGPIDDRAPPFREYTSLVQWHCGP